MKRDYQFVTPPDPNLVCCICHCILHQAQESPCQHVFCKVCINTWLNNHHSCPNCRHHLSKSTLKQVLPIVQNMISGLMVKCEYIGCCKTMQLDQYESHLPLCKYTPVLCRYAGCTHKSLRKDTKQHELQCRYRLLKCNKGCAMTVVAMDWTAHNCIKELKKHMEDMASTFEKRMKTLEDNMERTLKEMQAGEDRMQVLSQTNEEHMNMVDIHMHGEDEKERRMDDMEDKIESNYSANKERIETLEDRSNVTTYELESRIYELEQSKASTSNDGAQPDDTNKTFSDSEDWTDVSLTSNDYYPGDDIDDHDFDKEYFGIPYMDEYYHSNDAAMDDSANHSYTHSYNSCHTTASDNNDTTSERHKETQETARVATGEVKSLAYQQAAETSIDTDTESDLSSVVDSTTHHGNLTCNAWTVSASSDKITCGADQACRSSDQPGPSRIAIVLKKTDSTLKKGNEDIAFKRKYHSSHCSDESDSADSSNAETYKKTKRK